jgi:hypothetical protein
MTAVHGCPILPHMAWTFEEMLDDFRALGGVADNIGRRQGAHGWAIHSVDPAQPVHLNVPPRLLAPRDRIRFEAGVLGIEKDSGLGQREIAFLERYYAEFSWGGGGRESVEAFERALDGLPKPARDLLAGDFKAPWLFKGTGPARTELRFLNSRAGERHGTNVMIPIVELVNHAPEGADYALENGVGISGRFDGEVLAAYRHWDAFQIFAGWGFASPEPRALSLPVFVKLEARTLVVWRRLDLVPDASKVVPPVSGKRGRFLDVPFLLLGDRDRPELPRALFAAGMKAVGEPDTGPLFNEILGLNRERFARLAASVDGHDDEGSKLLREVCRLQLEALAHN